MEHLILQYSKQMFYRIILTIAILLVISQSQEITTDNQPVTSYLWFSWGPSPSSFKFIDNPHGGLASYYSHQKYPYRPDSGQQIFINLYPGYSELWESQLITCRSFSDKNYCLYIDSSFDAITGPQTPELSIGSLTSNRLQGKVLQLSSGETITMLLKDIVSERVEFFIMAFLLVCIITNMFSSKGLKYLSDSFSLQLTLTLSILIRETSSYVKEAIQNWLADSWKFWIFVPLSILAYQILQNFTEKCIIKRPNLPLFFSIIVVNSLLYYFGPSLLYLLASYCLILKLAPDPSLCEELTQPEKKVLNESSMRRMRLLFTLIHLKLLFTMQSCYFIMLNPNFYGIGLGGMACIYILDALRRSRERRAKDFEERKYKIKVFSKRSQLTKELPSLTLSGVLNEECPICYQKIENEWAVTPCSHLFHSECLHKWLEKSCTCPIDRKKTISDQPCFCAKLPQEFNLDY